MKISYTELQTFFDGKLPSPAALAEALTFHAWEIEGVEQVGNDTVLDVKVLPDKSAWALSHRGIAKDVSAILDIPLAHDPLRETVALTPETPHVTVDVATDTCTRYTAALIRGVKIGPSPKWLVDFLASMGQRSINNVVDLTNYVMFGIGQPLHAFDAGKLSAQNGYRITVRNARDGESITTLTGETYTLSVHDALIVDGGTDAPIGIAGVKGGRVAEVDVNTVDILLESAHFDAQKVRKTSQRLKLRTDASSRYENGLSRGFAGFGLQRAVELLVQECGGTLVGYVDTHSEPVVRNSVSLPLSKINSVLGLALTMDGVEAIIKRFGYTTTTSGEVITVTPPFERPDLSIPEDVIEEIGRIHGYEHVPSIAIEPIPLREVNKRFFYAEAVRDVLIEAGFSEIFTSSFRDVDEVKLKNALAADKGYLRSENGMLSNMGSALHKNAPNSDLFGTDQIRMFEFGKVFDTNGEREILVVGVQSKQGFVPKKDTKVLESGLTAIRSILGDVAVTTVDNVACIDFTKSLEPLPTPAAYVSREKTPDITYKPFSMYPYITRDIAFWTPGATTPADAEQVIRAHAGALAQRIDMFDRFEKEGRVSYGFRIVFQSYEKTLEGVEADAYMQSVYDALRASGFEVR